jgi:nitrous oxidase accessory protein NosD
MIVNVVFEYKYDGLGQKAYQPRGLCRNVVWRIAVLMSMNLCNHLFLKENYFRAAAFANGFY